MRSLIIGWQSLMKCLKLFYDMHLSYKLYLTNGNLSKSLHRENMSAIEGQRIAP